MSNETPTNETPTNETPTNETPTNETTVQPTGDQDKAEGPSLSPEMDTEVKKYLSDYHDLLWKHDPTFTKSHDPMWGEYRDPIINRLVQTKTFKEYKGNAVQLRKRILKVFQNYRSRQRGKYFQQQVTATRPTAPTNGDAMKGLLDLRTETSGRKLWESQSKHAIAQKRGDLQRLNPTANTAGVYQNAAKELWEALTDEERAVYDAEAAAEPASLTERHELFKTQMWASMTDICSVGKLGKGAMCVLYAFRDQKNTLNMSTLCTHSIDGADPFMDWVGEDQWEKIIESRWAKYAQETIPAYKEDHPKALRNERGQALFPKLDVGQMKGDDLREELAVFFSTAWGDSQDGVISPIPWTQITDLPHEYYDQLLYPFPCALGDPHRVPLGSVMTIAEFLTARSSDPSGVPFQFKPKRSEGSSRDTLVDANIATNSSAIGGGDRTEGDGGGWISSGKAAHQLPPSERLLAEHVTLHLPSDNLSTRPVAPAPTTTTTTPPSPILRPAVLPLAPPQPEDICHSAIRSPPFAMEEVTEIAIASNPLTKVKSRKGRGSPADPGVPQRTSKRIRTVKEGDGKSDPVNGTDVPVISEEEKKKWAGFDFSRCRTVNVKAHRNYSYDNPWTGERTEWAYVVGEDGLPVMLN